MSAAAPVAGFADPVTASQAHFRALLDALARPGVPIALAGELPAPPPGLAPASYALLLSLADYETPVWLGEPETATVAALRFHCGCPIAPSPGEAAFAVLRHPERLGRLDRFAQGSPEYPDRSTTLLLEVPGFAAGPAVELTGPGIEGARRLRVEAAGSAFWQEIQANHQRFPRGVDLVLAAGATVLGLPRSTALELL